MFTSVFWSLGDAGVCVVACRTAESVGAGHALVDVLKGEILDRAVWVILDSMVVVDMELVGSLISNDIDEYFVCTLLIPRVLGRYLRYPPR